MIPPVALLSRNRSTQPCLCPGSLNRVPAWAGVKAGICQVAGNTVIPYATFGEAITAMYLPLPLHHALCYKEIRITLNIRVLAPGLEQNAGPEFLHFGRSLVSAVSRLNQYRRRPSTVCGSWTECG